MSLRAERIANVQTHHLFLDYEKFKHVESCFKKNNSVVF